MHREIKENPANGWAELGTSVGVSGNAGRAAISFAKPRTCVGHMREYRVMLEAQIDGAPKTGSGVIGKRGNDNVYEATRNRIASSHFQFLGGLQSLAQSLTM